MQLTLVLSHLGTFFLGITCALVLLIHIGLARSDTQGSEGCFGLILCGFGTTVSLFCYLGAIKLHA